MTAASLLRTIALVSALNCSLRGFSGCEAHESPRFLSPDLFDFFTAKASASSAHPGATGSQEEDLSQAEEVSASWTPAYVPAGSVSASWIPPELAVASPFQYHPLEVFFDELLMKEFPDEDERRTARAIVEESAAGDEELKHNPEDLSAVLAAVANWKEQLRASINTLVNDDIGKSLGVSMPDLQRQKVESVLRYKMAKKLRLLELMKAFWSLLRIFRGSSGDYPAPPPPPPPPAPPSPPPYSTSTTTSRPSTTTTTGKPHKPHDTSTSTSRPDDGGHSAPGNSETILFLQVAPLTLLNRICQGQREACGQLFGDSLYEAMSAESKDSSFTRDRIKIGNASPRGGGVQQPVTILNDGDLYWAKILKSVVEDLAGCASDGSAPICKTMTGQTLTQYHVPVIVSSQRVVG